eukprot:gene11786-8097_t
MSKKEQTEEMNDTSMPQSSTTHKARRGKHSSQDAPKTKSIAEQLQKVLSSKELGELNSLAKQIRSTPWNCQEYKEYFEKLGEKGVQQKWIPYCSHKNIPDITTRAVVLMVLNCCEKMSEKHLQCWESLFDQMACECRDTDTAEGSRTGKLFSFTPEDLRIVWRHPKLASSVISNLLHRRKEELVTFFEHLVENIPKEYLTSPNYMADVVRDLHLPELRWSTRDISLPSIITTAFHEYTRVWATMVPLTPSTRLGWDEGYLSTLAAAVLKILDPLNNGESRDKMADLEEELNFRLLVWKTQIISIQDIFSGMLRRWDSTAGKEAFFAQLGDSYRHYLIYFLPADVLRRLIPATAVGGAATNWVQRLGKVQSMPTLNDGVFYQKLGSLLAEKAAANDPSLVDPEKGNAHQRAFILLYLTKAFQVLQVESFFSTPEKFVELLRSDMVSRSNLFVQCVSLWARQGTTERIAIKASLRPLDPHDMALYQVLAMLDQSSTVSILKDAGVDVVDLDLCHSLAEQVKELGQLTIVQVLCSYWPDLREKIAMDLGIDREWLDGPCETKWENESMRRLVQCTRNVVSFVSKIPAAACQLVQQMASSNAQVKSVLFDANMREYFRSEKRTLSNVEEDILDAIRVSQKRLEEFFALLLTNSKELSTEKVRMVYKELGEGGWSLDAELSVLSDTSMCRQLCDAKNVKEAKWRLNEVMAQLTLLTDMRKLLCPDGGVPTALCQFKFQCNEDSVLQACVSIVRGASPLEMNIEHLKKVSDEVARLFPQVEDVRSLGRICNILSRLELITHVWSFFSRNPTFVGEENYTYSFAEQVDGYISKLRKQKAQVMEQFKFLSHAVVVLLRSSQKNTFEETASFISRSTAFRKQLASEEKDWVSFVESLESIDSQMRIVEDIFRDKEDPFDVVVSQFEFAQKGFLFFYNLENQTVSMAFDKDGVVEHLQHTDTQEFLLQLRFAVRDDVTRFQDANADVSRFLRRFEDLFKKQAALRALHSAGHPEFVVSQLVVPCGDAPPSGAAWLGAHKIIPLHTMDHLDDLTGSWVRELSEKRKAFPWLTLLSFHVALELSSALQAIQSRTTTAADKQIHIRKAAVILYHVVAADTNLEACIRRACDSARPMEEKLENWLEYLTRVLGELPPGALPAPSSTRPSSSVQEEEKEHRCILYACDKEKDVWSALGTIYHARSPLPFEVLWCDPATDLACLDTLLRRAQLFQQYTFTLVRSELLPYAHQNILVQFLLSNSGLYNISFVECGESVLRTVQRVQVNLVLGGTRGKRLFPVTCYTGPSGCGKTYQLRKAVAARADDALCTLVVTEGFSLSRAIDELMKTVAGGSPFGDSGGGLLVAVQFSFGCYLDKERGKWATLLRQVNNFLFGLLNMGCVEDSVTGTFVGIPPSMRGATAVLVELPPHEFFAEMARSSGDSAPGGVGSVFPLLQDAGTARSGGAPCTHVNCREEKFDLGEEGRTIATYLKAYDDNTIDLKYDGAARKDFDVLFMLDISGSMRRNSRLEICKDQILIIVESMTEKDRMGLCTFNDAIHDIWDLNYCTTGNRKEFTNRLGAVTYSGGSCLFQAMVHGVHLLLNKKEVREDRKMYLVVLSDGSPNREGYDEIVFLLPSEAAMKINVIFMAIETGVGHTKAITEIVLRHDNDRFISTTDSPKSLTDAFGVVCEHLSVNEQIAMHAEEMTDAEVPALIWKYMNPAAHPEWTRIHLALWLQYMRRRCAILAASSSFDKNTDREKYGSTTMRLMLMEAEHAVSKNHVQWSERSHEHMVYRSEAVENDAGEQVLDYKWSIIATNQANDAGWREKLSLLHSLSMHVPSNAELEESRVLESYLAYAVGVDLHDPQVVPPFDFPLGTLPALREHCFVLTVDYLMKMLLINERIKCKAPCIVMGETGVSKTKVTEMLFKLRNSRTYHQQSGQRLSDIVDRDSRNSIDKDVIQREVCEWLRIPLVPLCSQNGDSLVARCRDSQNLRETLAEGLLDVLRHDPSLDPLGGTGALPLTCLKDIKKDTNAVRVLSWFMDRKATERYEERRNWMFIPVNMHAAMSMAEIEHIVRGAGERAERLQTMGRELDNFLLHKEAEICIFFDEFNTCSHMGLLKEVIQDRSLMGLPLPTNLVSIAACNPYRKRQQVHDTIRMDEQGTEWTSGHYNVRPLPRSLDDMTWDYGALSGMQEEEFIRKRLAFETLDGIPPGRRGALLTEISECVAAAQQCTRAFATAHVHTSMEAASANPHGIAEAERRGSSAVSLRDILRFFRMFKYFREEMEPTLRNTLFGPRPGDAHEMQPEEVTEVILRNSMRLSIAIVYYLRLSVDHDEARSFRKEFASYMLSTWSLDVEAAVCHAIDVVMSNTKLGPGIVETQSLQENLTIILLCLASKTPLIIKGPPGTSKTLAVQILCANAHGEFSITPLYTLLPAMISVHYQCSRQSSSREITEVFERAIRTQKSSDEHGAAETIYFVFMDEAGLPEEERESLKVLHYYLESNTRRATEIGFVAITNQLLDAANSNRCNMLSRAKYDGDELKTLAEGCLALKTPTAECQTDVCLTATAAGGPPTSNGGRRLSMQEVVHRLCDRFEGFIGLRQGNSRDRVGESGESTMCSQARWLIPDGCADFFSLRDFMHLFKLLGRMREKQASVPVSIATLSEACQRNFNGLPPDEVRRLLAFFLADFEGSAAELDLMQNPAILVGKSMAESQEHDGAPVSRYLLVTDTTTCDAVLSDISHVFGVQMIRMGRFKHGVSQEEMKALGDFLYDLFNQHYKLVRQQGKRTILRTNVAVGSLSVACDVDPAFGCLVFMSEAELHAAPAAFLDRLEKYRLHVSDLLHYYLMQRSRDTSPLWSITQAIVRPLYDAITELIRSMGYDAFFGVQSGQTIDSAVLALLRQWEDVEQMAITVSRHWTRLGAVRETARRSGSPVDQSRLPEALSVSAIRAWLLGLRCGTSAVPVAVSVLLEAAQREVAGMLLRVAIPERALPRMPLALVDMYLTEEHFLLFPDDAVADAPLEPRTVPSDGREMVFTRAIRTAFLRRLKGGGTRPADSAAGAALGEESSYAVLDFSEMSTEDEFRGRLEELWATPDVCVALLYDLPKCGSSSLNFCRHAINELHQRTPKPVLVLVTVSAYTHRSYDITFHLGWRLRYLDAIGAERILPWLRMAYLERQIQTPTSASPATRRPGGMASGSRVVLKELLQCLSSAGAFSLIGALECVPHPAASKFGATAAAEAGRRYVTFNEITSVLQRPIRRAGAYVTLADLVVQKFAAQCLLDGDEGAEDADVVIRRHIQSVVQSQADSPLTSCLSDTIQSELGGLLASQVVLLLKAVIPDLPPLSTTPPTPDGPEVDRAISAVVKVLEKVPSLPLSQLHSPVTHERIEMPYRPGFPFYSRVFRAVEHVLGDVYNFGDEEPRNEGGADDEEEEEEEEADWSDVLMAARERVPRLQDPITVEATAQVWETTKSDHLFRVYAANFTADRFPSWSKKTREFVLEWLLSLLKHEQAIPMLHITYLTRMREINEKARQMELLYTTLVDPGDSRPQLDAAEDVTNYIFDRLSHAIGVAATSSGASPTRELWRCVVVISQVSSASGWWVTRRALSPAAQHKAKVMRQWAAIFLAMNFSGPAGRSHSAPAKSSPLEPLTPILVQLFQVLQEQKGGTDMEHVVKVISQLDPKNTLHYVARLRGAEEEVRQYALGKVWPATHAHESVAFTPAHVLLAALDAQQTLSKLPLQSFQSFTALCHAVLSPPRCALDAVLHAAGFHPGADPSQYVPSWLSGGGKRTTKVDSTSIAARAVYAIVWGWLVALHPVRTEDDLFTALDALALQGMADFTSPDARFSSGIRALAVSAMRRLFLLLLAEACSKRLSTACGPRIEAWSAWVQGLLCSPCWAQQLRDQLALWQVDARRRHEIATTHPVLAPLLAAAAGDRPATPRPLRPLARGGLGAFQWAAQRLPAEMQAVTRARFMWVVPLAMDLYRWACGVLRRPDSSPRRDVLPIADTDIKSRWYVLAAAVAAAKACGDLPHLPDVPTGLVPMIALSTRHSDGTVRPGVLQRVVEELVNGYQTAMDAAVPQTGSAADAASCPSYADAQALTDLSNLGGMNLVLLSTLYTAVQSRAGVNAETAAQLLRQQEARCQVCSPVATVLEAVAGDVAGVAEGGGLKDNAVQLEALRRELRWFLARIAIRIPAALLHMPAIVMDLDLGSPTTGAQAGAGALAGTSGPYHRETATGVSRDLLHQLLHSLQLQGLRTLSVVLHRVMDQRSPATPRIQDVLQRWMGETGQGEDVGTGGRVVREWLAECIGLRSVESCTLLVALPAEAAGHIREFVEEQIRNQAYVFAEKPVELKKELPEEVERVLWEALADAPVSQLVDLTQLLANQEERLERNARQSHEEESERQLIPLLARAFQSRERLFRQYPLAYKISTALAVSGCALYSSHCIALRTVLLRCKRLREASAAQASGAPRKREWLMGTGPQVSTWCWQTEVEPADEESVAGRGGEQWGFLLRQHDTSAAVGGAQGHNAPLAAGADGVHPVQGASYRSIRAQLLAQVKQFDQTVVAAEGMRRLLEQLPAVDRAPVVDEATALLDAFDEKLKYYQRVIDAVIHPPEAGDGKSVIHSRMFTDAVDGLLTAYTGIVLPPGPLGDDLATAKAYVEQLTNPLQQPLPALHRLGNAHMEGAELGRQNSRAARPPRRSQQRGANICGRRDNAAVVVLLERQVSWRSTNPVNSSSKRFLGVEPSNGMGGARPSRSKDVSHHFSMVKYGRHMGLSMTTSSSHSPLEWNNNVRLLSGDAANVPLVDAPPPPPFRPGGEQDPGGYFSLQNLLVAQVNVVCGAFYGYNCAFVGVWTTIYDIGTTCSSFRSRSACDTLSFASCDQTIDYHGGDQFILWRLQILVAVSTALALGVLLLAFVIRPNGQRSDSIVVNGMEVVDARDDLQRMNTKTLEPFDTTSSSQMIAPPLQGAAVALAGTVMEVQAGDDELLMAFDLFDSPSPPPSAFSRPSVWIRYEIREYFSITKLLTLISQTSLVLSDSFRRGISSSSSSSSSVCVLTRLSVPHPFMAALSLYVSYRSIDIVWIYLAFEMSVGCFRFCCVIVDVSRPRMRNVLFVIKLSFTHMIELILLLCYQSKDGILLKRKKNGYLLCTFILDKLFCSVRYVTGIAAVIWEGGGGGYLYLHLVVITDLPRTGIPLMLLSLSLSGDRRLEAAMRPPKRCRIFPRALLHSLTRLLRLPEYIPLSCVRYVVVVALLAIMYVIFARFQYPHETLIPYKDLIHTPLVSNFLFTTFVDLDLHGDVMEWNYISSYNQKILDKLQSGRSNAASSAALRTPPPLCDTFVQLMTAPEGREVVVVGMLNRFVAKFTAYCVFNREAELATAKRLFSIVCYGGDETGASSFFGRNPLPQHVTPTYLLSHRLLSRWMAVNGNIRHPKFTALPIGLKTFQLFGKGDIALEDRKEIEKRRAAFSVFLHNFLQRLNLDVMLPTHSLQLHGGPNRLVLWWEDALAAFSDPEQSTHDKKWFVVPIVALPQRITAVQLVVMPLVDPRARPSTRVLNSLTTEAVVFRDDNPNGKHVALLPITAALYHRLLQNPFGHPDTRALKIVVGFAVDPNRRQLYNHLTANSDFCVFVKTTEREEFHSLLASNTFVASPIGSGFECYRTWEALSLGAIPILFHPDAASGKEMNMGNHDGELAYGNEEPESRNRREFESARRRRGVSSFSAPSPQRLYPSVKKKVAKRTNNVQCQKEQHISVTIIILSFSPSRIVLLIAIIAQALTTASVALAQTVVQVDCHLGMTEKRASLLFAVLLQICYPSHLFVGSENNNNEKNSSPFFRVKAVGGGLGALAPILPAYFTSIVIWRYPSAKPLAFIQGQSLWPTWGGGELGRMAAPSPSLFDAPEMRCVRRPPPPSSFKAIWQPLAQIYKMQKIMSPYVPPAGFSAKQAEKSATKDNGETTKTASPPRLFFGLANGGTAIRARPAGGFPQAPESARRRPKTMRPRRNPPAKDGALSGQFGAPGGGAGPTLEPGPGPRAYGAEEARGPRQHPRQTAGPVRTAPWMPSPRRRRPPTEPAEASDPRPPKRSNQPDHPPRGGLFKRANETVGPPPTRKTETPACGMGINPSCCQIEDHGPTLFEKQNMPEYWTVEFFSFRFASRNSGTDKKPRTGALCCCAVAKFLWTITIAFASALSAKVTEVRPPANFEGIDGIKNVWNAFSQPSLSFRMIQLSGASIDLLMRATFLRKPPSNLRQGNETSTTLFENAASFWGMSGIIFTYSFTL